MQLMVFKVIALHENTELLPSGYFYDLSPGNNDLTEEIILFFGGITLSKQLGWMKVEKED